MVAKIDRAYRTADGLVLTELKRRRRRRAYLSDVVELSAQKVAIERSTGERVADKAYVLIEDPASRARTAIEVTLLIEAGVVDLAWRYAKVVRGDALTRKTNLLALCVSCPYADRCRPEVLQGSREE